MSDGVTGPALVGITGTRSGATPDQLLVLQAVLAAAFVPGAWLAHGDCVGVDAQAHDVARDLGYRIRVFPPTNGQLRAFKAADEVRPAQWYQARNRAIVAGCEFLVVVPSGPEVDQPRSGTWMTYRMAVRVGRRLQVIR